MVDFLILYEVKARELENICLIRAEIEKRGYTVDFYNVMDIAAEKRRKMKAKVVVTSAMYCDEILRAWVYYIAGNVKKIVNLQWEQILTEEQENDKDCIYALQGSAKQVVHVCWGEHKRQILIKNGVEPEKAVVTGPIHIDFFREEFKSYYIPKKDLFAEFKLPLQNNTFLFISSFSYVNQQEQVLEFTKDAVGKSFNSFLDISIQSQRIILEWIEQLLLDRRDINFIYRPHPAESENAILKKLSEKYDNFYIIRDLSVKQWILACDTILNWYSTSTTEIFFANKTFYILRPIHIPTEMDITMFKEAIMLKTYAEFVAALAMTCYHFPIKEENIYANHDVDPNKASYVRICDLLEQVFQTTKYDIGFKLCEALPKITLKEYVKYTFVYGVYLKAMQTIGGMISAESRLLSQNIINKAIYHNWLSHEKKKNIASSQEIEAIMAKLRKIVNG